MECEYEQNDTRGELFSPEFDDGGVDDSENMDTRGEFEDGVDDNVGDGGIGVRCVEDLERTDRGVICGDEDGGWGCIPARFIGIDGIDIIDRIVFFGV